MLPVLPPKQIEGTKAESLQKKKRMCTERKREACQVSDLEPDI